MPSGRSAARTAFTLLAASTGVAASPRAVVAQQVARAPADGAACADGNGGLTLPPGFCAIIFADSLAGPRHMAVGADGLLYVALRGQRGAQGAQARPGGVMVLRDADGDGRAEVRRTLVEGFAATEAAVRRRALYTENGTAILRWALASDGLSVVGAPDTIARDLPGGGHAAKTFAFDRAGRLFVNFGSRTNACQERDRQAGSAGIDPCRELDERSGIWLFAGDRVGQRPAAGQRWATGIRNAVAIRVHPRTNELWVMQHGRDQLAQNWPQLFTEARSADTPAEELFRVRRGDDFGWPYCYFDGAAGKKVLAPEYGGDGTAVGRCATKRGNVASFPAHWAPNDLLFHSGRGVPSRYGRGAFIAFHGSWNRAPLPQAGANVVFLPMRGAAAAGEYEVFADGFASSFTPSVRGHRPTGLAEGPDGALYVSDDQAGRIWRIRWVGTR